MLGKLMKYEWKSVYKVGAALVAAILAVTIIGYFALRSPAMAEFLFSDTELEGIQSVIFAFMSMASMMLYMMLLVGAIYGIMIYVGVHFYKTMYTDQGYLIHTLPVKKHHIFLSKIFVSGVWVLFINLSLVISVVVLSFGMVQGVTAGVASEVDWSMFWSEMGVVFEELNVNTAHMLIVIILIVVLTPFTSVLQIFGALTIGQLSKKYKLLMGILAYIGLLVVNSIISALVQTITTFGYAFNYGMSGSDEMPTGYLLAAYDSTLVTSCVLGVVLYFVSYHIMNKKLNLE